MPPGRPISPSLLTGQVKKTSGSDARCSKRKTHSHADTVTQHTNTRGGACNNLFGGMHDWVVPICRYARKGPAWRRRIPTLASGDAGTHTVTAAPYAHTIRTYTAFGSAEMLTRIVYVDSYDRCTCTRGNMRIKDAFRRVRVTACMQPGVASLVAVAFAFASRAWHWHGTAASTTVH
jgi:hypothetical protein